MAQQLKQPDPSLHTDLAELLDQLDHESNIDPWQRIGKRRAIHAPVTLGVMAGGYKALYRGWATDLSPDGIGLLTEHDVPMGAVLYVNLESVAGRSLLLPIRICYVSRLLSKTFRVGGAFSFIDADPGNTRLSA